MFLTASTYEGLWTTLKSTTEPSSALLQDYNFKYVLINMYSVSALKKPINELVVGGNIEEFRISLQNIYSALTVEDDLSVQSRNDSLRGVITECAIEVCSKMRVRGATGRAHIAITHIH